MQPPPLPLALHVKRLQNPDLICCVLPPQSFIQQENTNYLRADPELLTLPSLEWEISPPKVERADNLERIQGVTSSRLWENNPATLVWRTPVSQNESSLLS